VIRDAPIVSPEAILLADIVVDGGVIAAIGSPESAPPTLDTIDAGGRYVIPGAIDVHVHLRDRG
jgi:dihydroorotase-like cyclic amidohydrolase